MFGKSKTTSFFTSFFIIFLFLGMGIQQYQFTMTEKKLAQVQSTLQTLKQQKESEKPLLSGGESQVINTVKKVQNSVVSIVASKDLPKYRGQSFPFNDFFSNDPFFQEFFGQRFQSPQSPQDNDQDKKSTEQVKVGGGSGFIYSEDGLIITNRHVVADEDASYTVVLFDGTELDSEVLARDDFNDVAILKVKAKDGKTLPKLHPVILGDSTKLEVGQQVVAIGNALAEFQNTVTTGIISAKGRQIVASDGTSGGENLDNLLQTDAAINPGNSGGPLVNLQGQVVGMNTAIAQGANGIGFALPVNDIKHFAEVVKTHGKYIRPFLGVRYMMLSDELAKKLNLQKNSGALLYGDVQQGEPAVIADSPADKAGLKMGDIITKIDGKELKEGNDLRDAVSAKEIGDTVKMEVWRNGETKVFEVDLEEMKK